MENYTNDKSDFESLMECVRTFEFKCSQGYGDFAKKGTIKRFESLSGLVAQIGDRVTISRTKDGEPQTNLEFELVEIACSFDSSNPIKKICIESPIGKGTIARKIGESFTYCCPTGEFVAKIENIITPEKENENVQKKLQKK